MTIGSRIQALRKERGMSQGTGWKVACAALSIFMIINLSFTLVCMVRWRDRRAGIAATTQIGQYVDSKYDDAMMSSRFCEWHVIKK